MPSPVPNPCCPAPAFPTQTSEKTFPHSVSLSLTLRPPSVPSGHHQPLVAGPHRAPLTSPAFPLWKLRPWLSPSVSGLSAVFLLQLVSGLPVMGRTQPGPSGPYRQYLVGHPVLRWLLPSTLLRCHSSRPSPLSPFHLAQPLQLHARCTNEKSGGFLRWIVGMGTCFTLRYSLLVDGKEFPIMPLFL